MAFMHTISHLDSTITIVHPFEQGPGFKLTDEEIKILFELGKTEKPYLPWHLAPISNSDTSSEVQIPTYDALSAWYSASASRAIGEPPMALDNYAKFFGDLYPYPNDRWKDLLILLGILNFLVLSMGILVRVMKSFSDGCATGDVDDWGESEVKGRGGECVGSVEDGEDSEEEEIDWDGEMVDEHVENND
ncbi:hypothetical protein OCU04_008402 [Sclerotinia nivalis]|uniref:Uncharacterized protein n=1 Tax=Sclerotinia nivalis TaxID=352851 RepID=A0A9X0ALL2_9HELO|nr:hypothetical protein OCU04_008402 [Sclerotinia nivalis]